MPKLTAAEKLAKKQKLEEKREARRLAKEKKEKEKKEKEKANNASKAGPKSASGGGGKVGASASQPKEEIIGECHMFKLSDDTLNCVLGYLPARDLGALVTTCRHFSKALVEARMFYLLSRLRRQSEKIAGSSGCIDMCFSQTEARSILEQSYGGGETGRIIAKGKARKEFVTEFVSYARFLEEAIGGYATQNYGGKTPVMLPPFVNGRFVSASPEHSICRVGGGGRSGAGGSGVACWGVGKRGQLGAGKRRDQAEPTRLLGGIGYTIRIVQVAAGGGLVRVAHSLLLTSTGRVLSFGTGQYGALGHGYSGGKQLPDVLRPQYIEALSNVRCTCVAAGELHSAAVSADGDVYTWGDGFCGQLGHGDKRPHVVPSQVTSGGLEDECVSHITCGARHTLAVSEDGEVFSWGLGHFGVLGRSFTPYDHDPDAALAALGGEGLDGAELGGNGAVAAAGDGGGGGNGAAQGGNNNNNDDGNAWSFENLMAHLDMIGDLSLVDSSDQCIPKLMEALEGIKIIGASAGHRHSLLLDERGGLYSCGAGISGCLGHGDNQSQMFPMKIMALENENIKIIRMSAGVDMSMAISTKGDVYGWGKTEKGRLGLGLDNSYITIPKQIQLKEVLSKEANNKNDDDTNNHSNNNDTIIKAVDVDCGYVHSLIVAVDGTVYQCGKVGIDGEADGVNMDSGGQPQQLDDFNIWHRVPEPKEYVKTERWKKYGKYEVRGRQKMLTDN